LGVLTDEEIHNLSTKIAEIACLGGRGGVLAMRPLIVHASSKWRTHARRHVLHIEYAKCGNLSEGLRLAVS